MEALHQKLKFKSDPFIINAPNYLHESFTHLDFKHSIPENTPISDILVFVSGKAEFIDFLNKHLNLIITDSVMWFAYPKMSSKRKSDINRDSMREMGEKYGIATVAAIAIDSTWSALRFRPFDKIGR